MYLHYYMQCALYIDGQTSTTPLPFQRLLPSFLCPLLGRYALSIMFVADGAPLLQEEGHIRYPDNEDYQVQSVVESPLSLACSMALCGGTVTSFMSIAIEIDVEISGFVPCQFIYRPTHLSCTHIFSLGGRCFFLQQLLCVELCGMD